MSTFAEQVCKFDKPVIEGSFDVGGIGFGARGPTGGGWEVHIRVCQD
jgi:hypothetical protein